MDRKNRQLGLPEASEVQVAVQATGLCGSDLHYYNHYRNGDIIVQEPLTLGHESSRCRKPPSAQRSPISKWEIELLSKLACHVWNASCVKRVGIISARR